MSTQIFLRFIKNGDINPKFSAKDVLNWMSPVTKDVIAGDALEAPFIKWIRVTGVKNSIGFDSGTIRSINAQGALVEQDYGTGPGTHHEALTAVTDREYDMGRFNPHVHSSLPVKNLRTKRAVAQSRFGQKVVYQPSTAGQSYSYQRTRTAQYTYGAPQNFTSPAGGDEMVQGSQSFFGDYFTRFQNAKLKIKLPDHNSFTFTKNTDNGTPQIAFACSAQEPIKHAFFAFRRRIGTGVEGIRIPYLVIWLRECLVTGWELNGDEETVVLKYKQIKWCSYDQVTDWNMPTGMSNRNWDVQDSSGGEDISTYLIMGALALATTALGMGLQLGLSPNLTSSASASRSISKIE